MKGVDHYIETAINMPGTNFTLVGLMGAAKEWCERLIPGNVTLIDFLHRERLLDLMNKTKVFCQFSRYDSFGMVLAESMAMGCIPVGTDYGGTREIMGKHGFLIKNYNIDDTVKNIRYALNMEKYDIHVFRNHIIDKFELSLREKQLLDIIYSLS